MLLDWTNWVLTAEQDSNTNYCWNFKC